METFELLTQTKPTPPSAFLMNPRMYAVFKRSVMTKRQFRRWRGKQRAARRHELRIFTHEAFKFFDLNALFARGED